MKLLTLNCYLVPLFSRNAKKRIRKISERISQINPDLVFLQEVYLISHKKLFINLLKNYKYYYFSREPPFGRGGGLGFFSKLPIEKKEFIRFSKSGYWLGMTLSDKLAHKGFMKIKIKAKKPFYCFNVHLTSNYKNNYSEDNKETILIKKQLDELAAEILKTPMEIPSFIAGDLNVPNKTELFERFIKKTGTKDISFLKKHSYSRMQFKFIDYFRKIFQEKLDYILSRSDKKIKHRTKYVILTEEGLSDHNAILTEI